MTYLQYPCSLQDILAVPVFSTGRISSIYVPDMTYLQYPCSLQDILAVPVFSEDVLSVPVFSTGRTCGIPVLYKHALAVPVFSIRRTFCTRVLHRTYFQKYNTRTQQRRLSHIKNGVYVLRIYWHAGGG